MLKKDYNKALSYLNQALTISEAQQNINLTSKINTHIANCYLATGETAKA